jgi:hypothetical protein
MTLPVRAQTALWRIIGDDYDDKDKVRQVVQAGLIKPGKTRGIGKITYRLLLQWLELPPEPTPLSPKLQLKTLASFARILARAEKECREAARIRREKVSIHEGELWEMKAAIYGMISREMASVLGTSL